MIDQELLDRLIDPEKGSELHELEIAQKEKILLSLVEKAPHVAQARNMSIGEHRHCCITLISKYKDLSGKKPIVSVTYENERIPIKKTAYLT